jgi:hypothetical protein
VLDSEFSPNAVAESNWVAYQRARDAGHDNWLDTAKKCDDYYLGDQWEESDKDKLDAEGRPALTINEILKVVNAFLGKQSGQRVDLTFKPRRDATDATAEALRLLVDQVLDNNSYEFVEKEVFEDGVVIDRGYFDVRMGFEDNLMGDVRINVQDPYEVLPDPDAKSYDPSGWNSVITTQWMTLDDVEAHYGKDKRREVESVGITRHTFGEDSVRYEGTRTFGDDDFGWQVEAQHSDDKTIRSVRVIERQWRKLTNIRWFVDNETGDMKRIPDGLSDVRAGVIAQTMNLSILARVGKRVRWTVTVDNVTLLDEWSPYRSFTIVPYFPFFRKGRASGVVKQLLDPQEQFNKMESQMLHIVNTTANSGWTVEEGALHNMTTEELEERGAETGLVLIHKRGTEPPKKIEANKIPSGLDRLAQKAQFNVAGIAGIEGMVKAPTREVSGVALDQIQQAGLLQVDVPFDALKRTRHLLAKKVLELIQDFYTETRVLRVTVGNGLSTQNEELVINAINAAGEIVNNMALGEYDIVVGTRPARDNYEDSQFANALTMREAGVMVPDDVVIRHSQLENKDQIADRVASLQGVAPPTEEEMQLAAYQSRLELRAMELSVSKLEGETLELQARAKQEYAKAQQLEGQAQMDALELALEFRQKARDLEAKLVMFYDNLENKLQLAGIHARNKRETTLLTEMNKHSMKELDVLSKPRTTNGQG